MKIKDPENTCAFCGEHFDDCHCDEVRQAEKDEELPTLLFGAGEKITGGGVS